MASPLVCKGLEYTTTFSTKGKDNLPPKKVCLGYETVPDSVTLILQIWESVENRCILTLTGPSVRHFLSRMHLRKQVEADVWVDSQKDKPGMCRHCEILYAVTNGRYGQT